MPNNEYEVSVSDAALAMLDKHMDFLARVSKPAAVRAMNEILDDIESLKKSPERFPIYENSFLPENIYRAMLSSRRYLVLYEVTDNFVNVDYIVDGRQDFGTAMLLD